MTLRIVELTQRFSPALGGVEQHVAHLATELGRAGHSVEIVTSDLSRDRPFTRIGIAPPPAPFPVRRHRAYRLLPAPHGLGILSPGMLIDALTGRADVIHAHAFGYFPTWVGALAGRLGRSKLVITAHSDEGSGTPGSLRYARWVTRGTLRQADRTVAQTEMEATRLRTLGVDPQRIEVIPTPIDLEEFHDLAPSRSPKARPVVLFVGRLYLEQKGLDLLLRALAKLPRDRQPDLRLVGEDWGSRPELERLASHLGVQDRVTITGRLSRPEVLREYASADLFVLPSRFDSFPVVLLEAMAAGLPIIATRVGGIPEVVAEGSTGLLVPPGDVDRLKEAMETALRDDSLRRSLGQAGLRAVDAYSWKRLAPRYIAMFSELARGGVTARTAPRI
ncbi:MAG: glycosyltransferase family 4 protein [Thermoplasmata archaeon]|nr:glycosyltransferase family 4 protein [Thermoplasmata archaeon]